MTRKNTFTKTAGSTYQCNSCGRRTRNTGAQSLGSELCPQCWDLAGIENEISDGYTTAEKSADQIRHAVADIEAKGGDASEYRAAWPELWKDAAVERAADEAVRTGTCTQCGEPFSLCDGPSTCKANQKRKANKAADEAAWQEIVATPKTDEEKILHVLSIPNAGYSRRQIRDLSGVGEEPTYRILRQLVAEGRIHGRMVKGNANGRPFRAMSFWRESNQMGAK